MGRLKVEWQSVCRHGRESPSRPDGSEVIESTDQRRKSGRSIQTRYTTTSHHDQARPLALPPAEWYASAYSAAESKAA